MQMQPDNRFQSRRTKANQTERIVFTGLRWLTYLLILVTIGILLHISFNGLMTILHSKGAFLYEKPQTLHVFEPRQVVETMAATRQQIITTRRQKAALGADQDGLQRSLNAEIDRLEQRHAELDAERIRQRKQYGDDDYRRIGQQPSEEAFIYSTYAYSAGGIGPAIVGSLLLVGGSILIAVVMGTLSAIYLSEYSKPGRSLHLIRLSIVNLSGVPSIVFGLFGFGIFVLLMDWGVSLLAGWLTLSLMVLPSIITAAEESLREVPKRYREASMALGAGKWTTVRTNVLPYALPGILVSSTMTSARIAAETAPILFTAAYALRDRLPWEGLTHWTDFFFQGVMALPYHVYVVSVKLPHNEYTRPTQYGVAFVLLVMVGSLAALSIFMRGYKSSKIQGEPKG